MYTKSPTGASAALRGVAASGTLNGERACIVSWRTCASNHDISIWQHQPRRRKDSDGNRMATNLGRTIDDHKIGVVKPFLKGFGPPRLLSWKSILVVVLEQSFADNGFRDPLFLFNYSIHQSFLLPGKKKDSCEAGRTGVRNIVSIQIKCRPNTCPAS